MSVEATRWFTTTHESHIYYYMSYTNDDVPPLLRRARTAATTRAWAI